MSDNKNQIPLSSLPNTIVGELIDHRIVGDDFFSIATIRTKQNGNVATVGKLLGVAIGDTIQLEGFWDNHKRYGLQFKVRECMLCVPRSDMGVIAWMAGRLKHVGKQRAEDMLNHFGGAVNLWKVIEETPDRLTEVKGITPKRAIDIVDAYVRFHYERDRMIQFKRWGLTDFQVAKILAKWGDESETRLKSNPYDLVEFVDGFGFIKADTIAQRMGVPFDAVPRIHCGLLHTMTQAAGHGHCFVASGKLVAIAANKVLRIDGDLVARELKVMRKKGQLVQHGKRTFLRRLNVFEQICADRIRALLAQRKQ